MRIRISIENTETAVQLYFIQIKIVRGDSHRDIWEKIFFHITQLWSGDWEGYLEKINTEIDKGMELKRLIIQKIKCVSSQLMVT